MNLTEESIHRARDTVLQQIRLEEENPMVLLTIGRLVARKGILWFLKEVFVDLLSDYPEMVYVVVGDGPEAGRISRLAKREGISDRVFLMGAVHLPLFWQFYLGSDLFVMPNLPMPNDAEGFGLVVQEAGAFGLPVVATRVDALRESVTETGECGILVPPLEPREFISAIEQFVPKLPLTPKARRSIRNRILEVHRPWREVASDYLAILAA